MGRVTFQEFRLADLHTMSTTARHGSLKFRIQSSPDSCHRGLKYTAFVLLKDKARLMPTVAKQT